ncbi:hypothetical protein [Phenylobacterium sp.]|uniref:hypothetical protein n=1 Tax=Phenylobacterium sp. TaxID=1871053 RepID=UPI0035C8746A
MIRRAAGQPRELGSVCAESFGRPLKAEDEDARRALVRSHGQGLGASLQNALGNLRWKGRHLRALGVMMVGTGRLAIIARIRRRRGRLVVMVVVRSAAVMVVDCGGQLEGRRRVVDGEAVLDVIDHDLRALDGHDGAQGQQQHGQGLPHDPVAQ